MVAGLVMQITQHKSPLCEKIDRPTVVNSRSGHFLQKKANLNQRSTLAETQTVSSHHTPGRLICPQRPGIRTTTVVVFSMFSVTDTHRLSPQYAADASIGTENKGQFVVRPAPPTTTIMIMMKTFRRRELSARALAAFQYSMEPIMMVMLRTSTGPRIVRSGYRSNE